MVLKQPPVLNILTAFCRCGDVPHLHADLYPGRIDLGLAHSPEGPVLPEEGEIVLHRPAVDVIVSGDHHMLNLRVEQAMVNDSLHIVPDFIPPAVTLELLKSGEYVGILDASQQVVAADHEVHTVNGRMHGQLLCYECAPFEGGPLARTRTGHRCQVTHRSHLIESVLVENRIQRPRRPYATGPTVADDKHARLCCNAVGHKEKGETCKKSSTHRSISFVDIQNSIVPAACVRSKEVLRRLFHFMPADAPGSRVGTKPVRASPRPRKQPGSSRARRGRR